MDFSESVWTACSLIPAGKVSTYKDVAAYLGDANKARAVGNALHRNPAPVKVPCHRVVRSDGALGGYALGPAEKRRLLESEGVKIVNGTVKSLEHSLYRFSPAGPSGFPRSPSGRSLSLPPRRSC